MAAVGSNQRVRKGMSLLIAGNMTAQICALLRYTILARFLGPEQLGLAATLILTAQFFDSVSDTGSDRFLVQDRHGDEPRMQGLVQLLAIGRGVTVAALLVLLAIPIATFYGEPGLSIGLMGLAAAPLVTGFLHFDLRRTQRDFDFAREGRAMLVAEIVATVVMIVGAIVLHSYLASLYGLIARSVAMVAMSHLTAQRRYRVGLAREHMRRLATFGLPLMGNGLFLFIAGQGDRLIVGNQLGVRELGLYSAVILLIFYPSMMLLKYIHTVQMPVVAAAKDSPDTLDRSIDALAGDVILLALGLMAGFTLLGPMAVPLLFGPVYAQPALVVAAIGVIPVVRFVRTWPETAALATGRSGVVLTANLVRFLAIPAALAGVWLGGGLVGLALGFAIGEYISLVFAVAMTNRALGMRPARNLDRLAMLGVGAAALCVTARCADTAGTTVTVAAMTITAGLLAMFVARERAAMARLTAIPLRIGMKMRTWMKR